MSFAGNTIRQSASVPRADDHAENETDDLGSASRDESSLDRPKGRSYDERRDWARAGLIGLGFAIGALIGVGAALLYAPQSGEETRAEIRRRARRLRAHAGDVWGDLGDDARWAAHRGKKRVRRGIRRSGWAAEDFIDAHRKPKRHHTEPE